MKKVPLYQIKNALSRYLRAAEREEIVITRHGRPAGLLIGFESEDDWFEYRMQSDPEFLRRIEIARESLKAGEGRAIETLAPRGGRRIRYGIKRAPGTSPRKKGTESRTK